MEIKFKSDSSPLDLDFHPSQQLVSVCTGKGDLFLYGYAADSEPERLFKVNAQNSSCSAVRFVNEGRAILTGSFDGLISATNVESGSAIAHFEIDNPLGRVMRIVKLTESTFASCDYKCIQVWDTRQRSCCTSFKVCYSEFADMTFSADAMKLLRTFEAGGLSVCDLRKNVVEIESKCFGENLLSVVIMKNGNKVVCGAESGALVLYSWGFFEDYCDRILDLSLEYVFALLVVDEDTAITGSSGGLISVVGILPNRLIRPTAVQSHDPTVSHILCLSISHDKRFIGSITLFDDIVKVWDLNDLREGGNN